MKTPDFGQRIIIGTARLPKIAKLICKIFGHRYVGVATVGADSGSTIIYCKRCKKII